MSSTANRAILHTSRQLLLRHSRRQASTSSAHRDGAHHVAAGSGHESFGKGFYISLSLIPLGIVGWTLATSSETGSWITRVMESVRKSDDELDRRQALHAAAIEQAAVDRHLFSSAAFGGSIPYELRCPETMNRSSPWNVAAGEGGADLSKVIAHYTKEHENAERDRVARMKDGKVQTVYDDTTGGRFPTWVPVIGSSKKVPPGYKE